MDVGKVLRETIVTKTEDECRESDVCKCDMASLSTESVSICLLVSWM